MYKIGEQIKKYREQSGYSQKEFAKLIHVSNSRLSNWEQGLNRPDIDTLVIICRALKVSPGILLEIEDIQTYNLTSHEAILIEAYRTKPHLQEAVDILLGIK